MCIVPLIWKRQLGKSKNYFVFVTWGGVNKTVDYFKTKRKLENPDKEDSPFVYS